MLIGSTLISTVIQVAIVFTIAGLVYVAFARKTGFRHYLGLYRAPLPVVLTGLGIGAAIAAVIIDFPSVRAVAGGNGTAIAAALTNQSPCCAIVVLVVTALFKTAASEEILFRGLIAKAAIRWLGFPIGNVLQATVFGAIHLVLFAVARANHFVLVALCINAGILGWVAGWLNEHRAGGSILPGYAMHASANLMTYLTIALLIR